MRCLRQAKHSCQLTLDNACEQKKYIIKGISQDFNIGQRRRLLELGLISGEEIVLIRKSFLGKTLLIRIKGYVLSLREEIAAQVFISDF